MKSQVVDSTGAAKTTLGNAALVPVDLTTSRLPKATAGKTLADSGIADGTSGGGVLTLAAAASYTLTVPATGTVGLIGTTNTWTLSQTFSAVALFADGTSGAPGITFSADTDTGIGRSVANTLDMYVGGTMRGRMSSVGTIIVSRNVDIASLNTAGFGADMVSMHAADTVVGACSVTTYAADAAFILRACGGTGATPAATPSGAVGSYGLRGHTGSAFTGTVARGALEFVATETWGTTANGTKARIKVTKATTTTTVVGFEVGDDQRIYTNANSAPSANSFAGHKLYGVTDSTTAVAGQIGELVESKISSPTNAAATGTYLALTSISLGAGDWDISGCAELNAAGAVFATTNAELLVGTTSASSTGSTLGYDRARIPSLILGTTGIEAGAVPRKVLQVTSTTTVYLNVQATYSAGTPTWVGSLSARRIR